MIFLDIPVASAVFLDANTFVYHFAPDPLFAAPCGSLLVRIKNQEIEGFTSTHVLSEVAHRLMTLEAMKVHGWPIAGIAQRLRQNPAKIQTLTTFRRAMSGRATVRHSYSWDSGQSH